jgi:hypothetical protein
MLIGLAMFAGSAYIVMYLKLIMGKDVMSKYLSLLAVPMLVLVLAACEEKTTEDKIKDAAESVSDGFSDAAKEFEN